MSTSNKIAYISLIATVIGVTVTAVQLLREKKIVVAPNQETRGNNSPIVNNSKGNIHIILNKE